MFWVENKEYQREFWYLRERKREREREENDREANGDWSQVYTGWRKREENGWEANDDWVKFI